MAGASRRASALALGLLALAAVAGTASAEEPTEYETRALLDFVRAAWPWGHVIILLAVAGIVLVVHSAMTIRRGAILPPLLVSQLEEALSAGDIGRARELCARATSLRNVLFAGLARLDAGPEAAARAADLAAERERLALRQFTGWVLLIAISAALVGVFGTVRGFTELYDFLAVARGSVHMEHIWDSYSKVLITGYMGFLVAVVLFPAWWFFSARAAMLAHEIETTAEDLIFRVRNAPAAGDRPGAEPRERT